MALARNCFKRLDKTPRVPRCGAPIKSLHRTHVEGFSASQAALPMSPLSRSDCSFLAGIAWLAPWWPCLPAGAAFR